MGHSEFRGIFPYLVTPLDEKGRLKEHEPPRFADGPGKGLVIMAGSAYE